MAIIHTNKENKEFSSTIVTGKERDILLSEIYQDDNKSEDAFSKTVKRKLWQD